ncbi:MAG TPA: TetR/AcrR family transcriptional regulator [Pseudonocardia sp.]
MSPTDTRTRIREAATALFRREGYGATGLKRIAADSGAPFGSIYHFFPGGKQELAEDAVRTSGPEYMRMVIGLLDGVPEPLESLENAFEAAARDLAASDYADACPIATLALEVAGSNETLRRATAEVFDHWVESGAGWFARWTDDRDTALWLSRSMIMLLEGAFVLARAGRDPQPLHAAGRSMVALARGALRR